MSSTRLARSFVLALFVCISVSVPSFAETKKPAPALPVGVASDGTLTHVYGRKREAGPSDAKVLGVDNVDELSCGIIDLIFANTALSETTLASILQNEYKGSGKIRGVRFVIDARAAAGSGKSLVQERGSHPGRMFDVSFDTDVRTHSGESPHGGVSQDVSRRVEDRALAESELHDCEWDFGGR